METRPIFHHHDETIRGLVVMGLDGGDHKLIFTNVAGVLDLAAIERIGEELDVPGLESPASPGPSSQTKDHSGPEQ